MRCRLESLVAGTLRNHEGEGSKMGRFRLIGLALLAVFALGAVMASAAQAEEAPYWTVTGTRLEAGQTRFITAKEVSPFVLNSPSLKLKVTCDETSVLPHAVLLGSEPGEPGTNDEIVTFDDCTVEGNGSGSECTKVTEPINTVNLKSELVEDKTKTKLLVLFQPASSNLLAELKFPKGCKVEIAKVTGSVNAAVIDEATGDPVELPSKKEEAESWELKFPASQPVDIWLIKGGVGKEVETKALEVNGTLAELSGTALILLAELNKNNELVSTDEEWSPLA
jgi:hypothetical protein